MKKWKPYVHFSWTQWMIGVDFDWRFRVYLGPIELVW